MKNSFQNFNNIGDKVSINNSLSITDNFSVARSFLIYTMVQNVVYIK